MFGFLIPAWIKWLAAGAIVSAGLYLVYDYRTLASTVAAQKGTIQALERTIKAKDGLLKANKASLSQLDATCAAEVNRLLNQIDIDKILKESEDPIGDALKFDPNAKRG